MEQWLSFCSSCIRAQFQSLAFSEVVVICDQSNKQSWAGYSGQKIAFPPPPPPPIHMA